MNSKDDIICFCNRVSLSTLKSSIEKGAKSLNEIYDACGAGSGPCGGSCRSAILALLPSTLEKRAGDRRNSGSSAPKDKSSITPKASEAPLPLVEAISLFNRRYYWEAHEVLEKLWMEERGKDRLFFQGLIQGAAALYHVLNANPQGVIRLAQEAEKKLKAYLPNYFEIPLLPLIEVLKKYEAQSREILGHIRPGFDYDLLPQIQLGPEMKASKSSP